MRRSSRIEPRPRSGFSLVELLVVISIITVLTALMMPAIQSARQVALQVRCGAQLRSSAIAMFSYASDSRDWGPTYVHWDRPAAYFSNGGPDWVNDYFTDSNALVCPTDAPYGATKTIGGKKWKTSIISSYHILFGLGISLGDPSTTGDYRDVFYGWRCSRPDGTPSSVPTYVPLPNLQFLSRSVVYHNIPRNQRYTGHLQNPNEQVIATDGWLPDPLTTGAATLNFRTFYGAGIGSTSDPYPIRMSRPVMHPDSDGLNILYADGHVKWKRQNEVSYKLKLVSGNSISIWW